MRNADVTITWEDKEVTLQNFTSESHFYEYIDSVREHEGIGVIDYHSDNTEWSF